MKIWVYVHKFQSKKVIPIGDAKIIPLNNVTRIIKIPNNRMFNIMGDIRRRGLVPEIS